MMNTLKPLRLPAIPITTWLIGLDLLILAIHPVVWLTNTWFDPAYDSSGFWIFWLAVILFFWSFTSPSGTQPVSEQRKGFWLLLATSSLRLISQLMAVNILGAMTLAADVHALGLMTGLKDRKRAVSPFWLAVVFGFSLPITNVLQRTLGYLLQQLSALGAASLLGVFYRVQVEGIRILLAGQNILVDLPCAGTQSATYLLLFFALLMTLKRPKVIIVIPGLLIALLLAYLANTVRITVLAIGIAFPNVVGHVDVMSQPWHDEIGLASLLFFGLLPLLWLSRRLPGDAANHQAKPAPQEYLRPGVWFTHLKLWLACGFVACALLIISLPAHPMDVSPPLKPVWLPMSLDGGNRTAGSSTRMRSPFW